MTTIPETTLQKYAQLQQLATIAMATSDGLRNGELDHWRAQLSKLSVSLADLKRTFGEVIVGDKGEAYISTTRKIVRGNAGHKAETYEHVSQRREDLDRFTLPVWQARQRLESAREQHAAASARAGALRRVVEDAKQALQARGWRGDR